MLKHSRSIRWFITPPPHQGKSTAVTWIEYIHLGEQAHH